MKAALWVLFFWLAFSGIHIIFVSLKVRSFIAGKLGEKTFLLFYSLVSTVTFLPVVFIYFSNRHEGPLLWSIADIALLRYLAMAIAGLGVTLFVASFFQPSSMMIGDPLKIAPRGLNRITRYPFFMSMGLWGFAHTVLNGYLTDIFFFSGFFVLAVSGCKHKDAHICKVSREKYESLAGQTSHFPFAALFSGPGGFRFDDMPWLGIAAGVLTATAIYNLHPYLFF